MKAVVYTAYGPPDVLQLRDVEKPVPKAGEVLVRVHAVAANPLDWRLMRGEPFLARFENGLQRPRKTILGADIAGRVEALGGPSLQFQPDDEVFGDLSHAGWGGFAEYAVVPQEALAHKPENVSFEAAAAIPVAGCTALQGLRDAGQLEAGQRVLINGASGGVGTFAVQLAKAFGAEVTAVCSTRNLELVRSIGADNAIDYTQEDFTQRGERYDLIFDAVGNYSVSAYRRTLNPAGRCVVVGFKNLANLFQVIALGSWASSAGRQKVAIFSAKTSQTDLLYFEELLETGKVVPVIDRTYPLSETAEAIHYLETERARGKVVITV